MYSDYINSRDKNGLSLIQRLEDVDSRYLSDSVDRLKKAEDFYVFGGGVRAVKIAQYFSANFGLVPVGFLVNKRYMPVAGKIVTINVGKEVPIYEYESLMRETNGVIVLLLGIPELQVPEDILNSPRHDIVSVSFPNCIDGNNYIPRDYYEKHKNDYEAVYDMLADEYSKESYFQCMKGRLSGTRMDFAPVPWNWEEYFLPDIIRWKNKELLVDCGAFTGDTIEEFLRKIPTDEFEYKIYSFEPSYENYSVLVSKYKDNPRIHSINRLFVSLCG